MQLDCSRSHIAIGLDERLQTHVPERTPDWWDLLFSYLGVAAGAWIAWKLGQKRA
jgi:VanZ family protein